MRRDTLPLPDRGIELSLVDFGGDGPLAVVSHANGFCASVYEPLAAGLRRRFRVVAFDSRGHGHSSAPPPPDAYEWEEFVLDWLACAKALCERTGHDRVALGVGHSFGGSCLAVAASREPALFARTALLDPVVVPGPPAEGEHPMAAVARKRSRVFPHRELLREKWFGRGIFAGWDEDAFDRYLRDGLRDREDGQVELRCAPEVEAAVFQLGPKLDLAPAFAALDVPTLWLHAAKGNFPLDFVERVATSSAAVVLESLPVAHLLAMTHPAQVADRLLAWGEGRTPG